MMPLPSSETLKIPEEFDPDQHCGAAVGDTVCMRPAGWGVRGLAANERPQYRCVIHAGIPATLSIPKNADVAPRITRLEERIEQIRNSAELLTLEDQIAALRAIWEQELSAVAIQSDLFNEYLVQLRAAAEQGIEMPPPPEAPQVNTRILETLAKLVKTEYEMRYSKRFSVPIEEVGQLLLKLVKEFNKIADKYQLPPEVKEEYARAVLELRTRPAEDPALMRVMRGPYSARQIIEGEVVGSDDY